jgi:hypothetical protein
MQAAERRRAVAAAMSAASAAGLAAGNAVVLNDSNRLVVRLTPCDIVVPVAGLDARVEPRVFARDGDRYRDVDQHPSGRQSGVALFNVLRDGPPWPAVA